MKKLRISAAFNLDSYPKDDFLAYVRHGLRFYREAGLDAADLTFRVFDLSSEVCLAQAEEILRASEECGIRFEIGHLPFTGQGNLLSPDAAAAFCEKMHRAIDAMARVGVKYAVVHPNTGNVPMRQYDPAAAYCTVMEHLSPFVEHANRVGLDLVVENMRVISGRLLTHRFCQTPEELCSVADALGIGVCWDFGHANISGIPQSEGLSYIGKRLKVIHVNDNTGMDDDHLPPFMGNINWRDAMHGLSLVGFEGLFNFEVAAGRVPAEMRRAYVDYLVSSAGELMGYIE